MTMNMRLRLNILLYIGPHLCFIHAAALFTFKRVVCIKGNEKKSSRETERETENGEENVGLVGHMITCAR